MSSYTSGDVYTGLWINWSQGIMTGATLTLKRGDANLLIASLAKLFLSHSSVRDYGGSHVSSFISFTQPSLPRMDFIINVRFCYGIRQVPPLA